MLPEQWCPSSRDVRHLPDSTLLGMQNYVAIATNPEGWQSLYISVRAHSRYEAKLVARRELAKTKRDDWSVDLVVEAA